MKVDAIYGDHIYLNDGAHLSGGIADDAQWQGILPENFYNMPKKQTGKHTPNMLKLLT
jgi:hypothetical protein